MRRSLWLAIAVGAFFTPACGGGDDNGGGAGGSSGNAGSGPTDHTAPEFAGVTAAEATTDLRISVSWANATDDVTPEAQLAYRIYLATAAGAQDFEHPSVIAPAGATAAVIGGLVPGTTYYAVVRAVDSAGNEDQNKTEKSATTPDHTAPRFAGVTQVTPKTSHSLFVEWNAARDQGAKPEEMRYRVYVSDVPAGENFSSPSAETEPGASSAIVEDLIPLTDYYVVVRAVDKAGNEDDNIFELKAHTPEGEPPLFLGARQAIANGTSIKVYWAPATDNVTEQANIVYDIYQSKTSGGEDFSVPTYSTLPAAISYVAGDLSPGTKYFFVVRARDNAGNDDGNTLEVNASASGQADTVAPSFGGVTSVAGTSPSTLLASWASASDDHTSKSRIAYDVFVSDTSGAESFSSPAVTVTGITSATLFGISPGSTRFVVVRARDDAGNFLALTSEKSGTTLDAVVGDTTPPTFSGTPSAALIGAKPSDLKLTYSPATDNISTAPDIRYHACASTVEKDCLGANFTKRARASSSAGQTTLTISGLLPRTNYFVVMRAEDKAGNLETVDHETTAITATSYTQNLLPLLQDRCNGCHSFSYSTTVNVLGGFVDPAYGNLKFVDPGKPEFSLLYRRANPLNLQTSPFSPSVPNHYSGTQEPRDGTGLAFAPLSGDEDGTIRDWIAQGANASD